MTRRAAPSATPVRTATPAHTAVRVRTAAVALAGALLVTGLGAVAAPAHACACGGAVERPGDDVEITHETAVLQWDGTRETVVMQLSAETDVSDFALVVPTPSPATASLSDADLIDDLRRLSEPRADVERRWWPEWSLGDGDGSVGAQAPGGVSVLERSRLGPLEVTTLAATEADALTQWLSENGYVMEDALADAFQPYVDDGWYYVAVRVASEEDMPLDGELQPLELVFDSDELVYPMRLSAAAQTAQSTRTYVLSDHRTERTDAMASGSDVRFAGRIVPGSADVDAVVGDLSPALEELLDGGDYLTTVDQTFTRPAEQIVGDYTFGRAADDEPYAETVRVTEDVKIMGFFAGPVIVAGIVGAAALAVGLGLVVRRRSRAAAQRG